MADSSGVDKISSQDTKTVRIVYDIVPDLEMVVENWMRLSLEATLYSLDVIRIIIMFVVDYDTCKLAENPQCVKLLKNMGENFPNKELIILSENLIKINKRGKMQNRILLLTNKALYNLKQSKLSKSYRRIDLNDIGSVTTSIKANKFMIHIVSSQKDYRYKSDRKDTIISVLSNLYKEKNSKSLSINHTHKELTPGMESARLPTREQRFRHFGQLVKYHFGHLDEIDYFEKVEPNDFEFVKSIGRRDATRYYTARHKQNNEMFIMKIINKKSLLKQHQVDYIYCETERKILQQLHHPFLMQFRHVFKTETRLYFVMGYIPSTELLFLLKKKRRFPEHEAQFIVAEVVMVLDYLHSQDIIYKELKPENILVSIDGHICVKDNGLAMSNDIVEVPEYIAPEIIMNLGCSKAVDWWSCGILLYELIVGIPPFYSQRINEMYRKIKEAPLLFTWSDLSESCKDLIGKLLERDTMQRLDVDGVKSHTFFNTINWNKLYQKDIDPPYKPTRNDTIASLYGFKQEFVQENIFDVTFDEFHSFT